LPRDQKNKELETGAAQYTMATAHPENSFSDLIAFDLLPSRLFGGKEKERLSKEAEKRNRITKSDQETKTFSSSSSLRASSSS